MIEHRVLSPAEFRRMPWKNGGGLTTELASYPPRAALDAFDWRVSVADITRDGPFSYFEGIDRTIVLISGGGIRLEGPGRTLELRASFEPYAFFGEDPIHCTLLDGPVRDFNVMLRRGRARGDVTVVQKAGARIAPARFCLCYAVTGAFECLVAGRPPINVATDHTLLLEDPVSSTAVMVNPLTSDSVALVATIDLAA
jgi:environmental stress-induced protein Ves